MLKSRLVYLFALLIGALASFSFAPYSFGLLMIVTMAGLLFLIEQHAHPFRVGFCFALGFYSVGLRWVHVSIHTYGGLPLIVSYLAVGLLAAYLALYPALACYLVKKWPSRAYLSYRFLAFPACWMLGEWLRAHILTGFPWLMVGYSQVDNAIGQWGSLFGIYGVSVMVLWLAAALYTLLAKTPSISLKCRIALVIPIGCIWAGGQFLAQHQFTTPTSQPMTVMLVQGNESIENKWSAKNQEDTISRYLSMTFASDKSKDHHADVVIWPESAMPMLEQQFTSYANAIDKMMAMRHQALITGIIHRDSHTQDYYNALIVLGQKTALNQKNPSYKNDKSDRYYKRHLLPIGEFVPFKKYLRPLGKLFDLPMSDFSEGSANQPQIQVKGHRWLSAICYEIAFGDELQQLITSQTDTLLTISNDTWFGHSIGPAQHLQIAKMRAIELQRPLVRATNSGLSATVDIHGHVIKQLPPFISANLYSKIQPATGYTPYQRWGRIPIYMLFMIALIVWGYLRYKGRGQSLK